MDPEPHGLVYPPQLLDRLPVLPDDRYEHNANDNANDNATPPIRVLTPAQFAELHLQYTLTHPPDNVLFPFLHGLEGDNHAQNAFFATSPAAGAAHATSATATVSGAGGYNANSRGGGGGRHGYGHGHDTDDPANRRIVPKVPCYRGLVWVVCEDDLERAGDQTTLRILRRKPAPPSAGGAAPTSIQDPAAGQPFGIGMEGDEEHGEEEDGAPLPVSSSSSSDEDSECAGVDGDGESDLLEDDDLSMYDDDEALHGMHTNAHTHTHTHTPHINTNETHHQPEVLQARNTEDELDAAQAEFAAQGVESGFVQPPLGDVNKTLMGLPSSATSSSSGARVNAAPGNSITPGPDTPQTQTPHTSSTQGSSSASARRQSSASASSTTTTSTSTTNSTSPGLDTGLDTDSTDLGEADADLDADAEDEEDFESVLASPVHIPMPMNVDLDLDLDAEMQLPLNDVVHVVQPSDEVEEGVGVGVGMGEGRIFPSSLGVVGVGVNEGGGAANPGMPLPMKTKKEESYEGTHMHPVVARPVPALSTAGGLVGVTAKPGSVSVSPGTPSPSSSGSSRSPSTSSSPSEEMGMGMVLDDGSSCSSPSPVSSSREASEAEVEDACQGQGQGQVQLPSPSAHPVQGVNAQHNTHRDAHHPNNAHAHHAHQTNHSDHHPHTHNHAKSHSHSHSHPHHTPKRKRTNPAEPPLFTSTFRPKELLRRVKGAKLQIHTAGTSTGIAEGRGGPAAGAIGGQGASGASGARGAGEEDEDEKGWEFVPARVPDGISLRNFGIQVPIYATLSDIVVYSPLGATPAAISLARRFRTAIRAKRLERLQAAGLGGEEDEEEDEEEPFDANHGEDTQHITEQERLEREERRRRRKEFVHYNVFVLDATEDEMRKSIPHLMMRICGAGVPGGQAPHTKAGGCPNSASSADKACQERCTDELGIGLDTGAHTDGPDGHIIELYAAERAEQAEMERKRRGEDVVDTELDPGEAMDVDGDLELGQGGLSSSTLVGEKKKGRPRQRHGHGHKHEHEEEDDLHLIPNTVDFALREREEMRDLTKASEIISLYPISSISPSLSAPAPFTHSPPTSSAFVPLASGKSPAASSPISEDAERDAPPSWDPRVGQVFLGNSGDVPLAPELPTHFRHAASVPRDVDEATRWGWEALTSHLRGVDGLMKEYGLDDDELNLDCEGSSSTQKVPKSKADPPAVSDEDPFNYLATNDPARGYGYDICVECHDLAPFPSTAHLRAADEHLGMLDVMWRERWERAWLAKEERRLRRENKQNGGAQPEDGDDDAKIPNSRIRPPPPAPPRPPPHANAVIHLPFPSSPPNSQATMVALMPVIRFLEKWIQPVPLPVPVVQPPSTPSQTELKNLRILENLDPKKNAAGASASASASSASSSSRRWSSVTALMPSLAAIPGLGGSQHEKEKEQQVHAAPSPPPAAPLPAHPTRTRSMTTPSYQLVHPPTPVQARTRPLKILLYSSDGYTESSVPALCLLMAIKALNLPEAYLELQVEKRRSFFVYQADLGILRRVEARLREEREREKEKERERERERERMAAGAYLSSFGAAHGNSIINANGKRTAPAPTPAPVPEPPASRIGGFFGSSSQSPPTIPVPSPSPSRSSSFIGRPAAKSVSFAHGPPPVVSFASQDSQSPQHPPAPAPMVVPSLGGHTQSYHHPLMQSGTWPGPAHGVSLQQIGFSTSGQMQHSAELGGAGINGLFASQQAQPQPQMGGDSGMVVKGRARANTSPWLPSLFGGDHQSWFNDPRFDGSFPSRVLPFLYLGNLNHASNVYMLHALGITHVVSVGECALVPPPHHMSVHMGGSGYRPPGSSSGAHFVPGKGPGAHGSLWIEEREGRIKVLDIKGVCDDGIDTLEPQLEPICDWIDKARQDGGQVLVHCRVGVSRSATVTIAYVMKHLELPLVDAYLIVRSRRLSVLIQPNMRLLYNLCGWEIKLAKERAKGDERKLKKELARTLTWPYLAKEVHALNEKYLH